MRLLFTLLTLSLPANVEAWDDRKGDAHKDNRDMIMRIITTLLCAIVNALFINPMERNFWFELLLSTLLSIGLFALQFPYLVNLWMKRKKWYSDLSQNPNVWPDNQGWWKGIPWYARLAMVAIIFGATLTVYLNPEKLVSWY